MLEKNNNIIISLVILMIFVLFWFPADSIVWRSDSHWYLLSSKKLLLTGEYPGVFRGPVFSIFGAICLYLSNLNPISVHFIPRLSGALVIIGLYMLVAPRFGALSGIICVALLTLTPLFVESTSIYHVDITLCALMLLYLAAFSYGSYSNRLWLTAISGIMFTTGFLTKELAILLFPVPLVLAVICYWPQRIKHLLVFYGTVITLIAPWAIHVSGSTYGIAALLGRHQERSEKFSNFYTNITDSVISALNTLFSGIAGFYSWLATQGVWIVILSVIGLICLFYYWWRNRDLYSSVIGVSILAFIPFAIHYGTTVMNQRQVTTLLVLIIASIAPVISIIWNKLSDKIYQLYSNNKYNNKSTKFIAYTELSSIIGILLITLSILVIVYNYNYATAKPILTATGEFNRSENAAGEWFKKNINNDSILILNFGPSESLFNFHIDSRFTPQFNVIGAKHISWNTLWPANEQILENKIYRNYEISDEKNYFNYNPEIELNKISNVVDKINHSYEYSELISLWLQKERRYLGYDCFNPYLNDATPPTLSSCKINAFTSALIASQVDEFKPDFILVQPRFGFLITYFDQHPAYKNIVNYDYKRGDKTAIYEINPGYEEVIGFDTVVSYHIPNFLRNFEETNSERYNNLIDNFILALSKNIKIDVDKIKSGNISCFNIFKRIRSTTKECYIEK